MKHWSASETADELRSRRRKLLPIVGEAIHENHALRIADVQDSDFLRAAPQRNQAADLAFVKNRLAHVHFEYKTSAAALEQPQLLGPGTGGDGQLLGGKAGIRSAARPHNACRCRTFQPRCHRN